MDYPITLSHILRKWVTPPEFRVIVWDSVISPEYEGDTTIDCTKCLCSIGLVRDERVIFRNFMPDVGPRTDVMAADPKFFENLIAACKTHICYQTKTM